MFTPSLGTLALAIRSVLTHSCRNIPGSSGFPTENQWQALNSSVSGRLVHAVPSGEYCRQVNCTDAEWTSGNWRITVPGAMNEVNWEQDYESNPPSLCGRTTPQVCGQGDVPLYAILAEDAEDIQAGVNFARDHNLRLSVKSSGHDLLGRSTAKHSLLIHTHKLQLITFTDNFHVNDVNKGSAVTVGSGVGVNTLYNASGEVGKIVVGATGAASVVTAGGYVQGAGHSSLSPLLGLAADNVLEFSIVTADGVLRKTNEHEHPDLFWALRGGGAGSWGVIVSATFQTFPTFEATQSTATFTAANSTVIGDLSEAYAKHIFDWDSMNAGQALFIQPTGVGGFYVAVVSSYFPRASAEETTAALAPLFSDFLMSGAQLVSNTTNTAMINTLLIQPDDAAGTYGTLGSRLIPRETYKSPKKVGEVFKQLLDIGTVGIVSNLAAGGKVAENAHIDSAVNPGWRTAKVHVIISDPIPEEFNLEQIHAAENEFKTKQLPILSTIQGPVPAAYSNEADPFEQDWQSVFYGSNYHRLSAIKTKYDPTDLFIVHTGVGSERWDSYGLCKV